jgi:hypothetical protein
LIERPEGFVETHQGFIETPENPFDPPGDFRMASLNRGQFF